MSTSQNATQSANMSQKCSRARAKAKTKAKKAANRASRAEEPRDRLNDFHIFSRLPTEMRWLIISMAVRNCEKARSARLVLFDNNTRRISPTRDLADHRCPLLYVNKECRNIALGSFFKVDIFSIGPPTYEQYGPTESWYNAHHRLEYDIDIALQIDREAREAIEAGQSEGCVYINPGKDIFIIGTIPIQLAETDVFRDLTKDNGDGDEPNVGPWAQPHWWITERLAFSACAKITSMREVVWDPTVSCPRCSTYHPSCCSFCFWRDSGHDLERGYHPGIFRSIRDFGYYVMGNDSGPERFFHSVCCLGSRNFLKSHFWNRRYFEFSAKDGESRCSRL